MINQTFEVKATRAIQEHLNRNPRVVSYIEIDGGAAFEVDYKGYRSCPALIRCEARALGLDELAPRGED
jgi:hypothetical protein